VVSLSAGMFHTCAALADGSAHCWGGNGSGQLGDGTLTSTDLPTPVSGLGSGSGVTLIAAGAYHTCAVTADGAAHCWGSNMSGNLGNATYTDSPVPVSPIGF
jgi:alpha-tubulin suppressor-like RCC1 family protein